jgi:NAD(P)-dependent dehydrogenase (short-subunit alcohol dehydrogenase family)
MKRLKDRVAVVTGAASGIGRATAIALANQGCHLAIADVNDEGLEETKRAIEKTGRSVSAHHVDVSDKQRMQAFVGEVKNVHGATHVLVNNAGVSVGATFENHSLEDFEWLFGINFWGVVYGCKFFLPELSRADEAHIVNISSIFGIVGVPMNSSYCASKFAVRGLSEALRVELAEKNIGVTSIHPGGIATNIVKSSRFTDPDDMPGLKEQTVRAFEKMLPPEKAAEAIVHGIQRNAPRVLITREAYLIDAARRVFPAWSIEILKNRWHKRALPFEVKPAK